MNRQQFFNPVWDLFVGQGAGPSYETAESPTPAYQGRNEARSPLGVNIPDIAYSPHMEKMDVDTLLSAYPGLRKSWRCPRVDHPTRTKDRRFLTRLQACHDNLVDEYGADIVNVNPTEWTAKIKSALSSFARRYNLSTPETVRSVRNV